MNVKNNDLFPSTLVHIIVLVSMWIFISPISARGDDNTFLEQTDKQDYLKIVKITQANEWGLEFYEGPDNTENFCGKFRYYQANIDGKSGLEDIISTEWKYGEYSSPVGYAPVGYFWIDLDSCKFKGAVAVEQGDKRNADGIGTVADNHSVLINYSNNTYVLSAESYDICVINKKGDVCGTPKTYALHLDSMRSDEKSSRSCRFKN